jgi:hypothetical protein
VIKGNKLDITWGQYRECSITTLEVEMAVVNLTPHTINIIVGEKNISIPPSGVVARVSTTEVATGEVGGIPTFATKFGEVVDLPSSSDDDIFVTSALVVAAVPNRKDVFSPGKLIRDGAGNVVGCAGLTRPA